MSHHRKFYRPSIEILERRDTPSNFAVAYIPVTHTLNIVGDSQNDQITVDGVVGDTTAFTLLSPGADTFNGNPMYSSPSGVQNITMTLRGANTVLFDNSIVQINLQGSLLINGGNGDNLFTALDMNVAKNVTLVNGTGGSTTTFNRDAAGFSSIGGNVSITNGAGVDTTYFIDMNIGGNVTVNDGHGDGAAAGKTEFFNTYNTGLRSLIKGNVTVSYLDGTVGPEDGIWDTEVKGNVTFNQGTGAATANFDGYKTTLPVLIQGNLSITGSGSNTVTVGTEYNHTGLIVGGSFTVATPATIPPSAPVGTLNFTNLHVGMAANFVLGNGSDTVTIITSVFLGTVTLTTGAGNDATTLLTVDVNGALTINGGAGSNYVNVANLQVGGSLAVSSSNTAAANFISSTLTDLTVTGNVTINNGNGNTTTTIQRDAAGFNAIGGNVSIANGTGADNAFIDDTNVGGNLTVNNGNGNASGIAGFTAIENIYNSTVRAVIKGNVSVSYLTGDVVGDPNISDTEIRGNVTLANGSGAFNMNFDAFATALPVLILGSLSVAGAGANTVTVGTGLGHTGLIVDGNFTITTGMANDTVTFQTLDVHGALTINGGAGVNTITATGLQAGSLAVSSSNTVATNGISSTFTDLTVTGDVTIRNGNGNTGTYIQRDAAGFNAIGGNVSITNGTGDDVTDISDTNIGGNLTANNGNGDAAGIAGLMGIYNIYNTSARSVIKGNVSVSYLTGAQEFPGNMIADTEIRGNVTFANGSGAFTTNFDGHFTALPVLILGTLSITGAGANTVTVGTKDNNTGMIVGGNFTITTGMADDAVTFKTLNVHGALTINGGAGANTVTATGLQAGSLAVSSSNTIVTNSISNLFTDLTVVGAVTINNGNGNTGTKFWRDAAGFNAIGGNVSITNGTGSDSNFFNDTNIGGNLTVNNGNGDASGNAGSTQIFNVFDPSVQAVIKGNVSVSYLTGNVSGQGIADTEIRGNATFANGSGAVTTNFDGFLTTLPVLILGSLSITGAGANAVTVGTEKLHTGLKVGGNFTITTGMANDTVTVQSLDVHGALTIKGGAGANTVNATELQAGSVAVSTANTIATNAFSCVFTDLNVTGAVTINNGNGDTHVKFWRGTSGFNTIGGNVSITNGTGSDSTFLNDTDIGGNLTINNGNGDAGGNAGSVQIFNVFDTSERAVIKGNLSVSFLTGNVSGPGIEDAEIRGNVTLANGKGAFSPYIDGFVTGLPVLILGSLSVTSAGPNTFTVGIEKMRTGLIVGGNFTISTPPTTPATSPIGALTFFNLQVTGNTNITLGNGNDLVIIDDSLFRGAFTLTTGAGKDTVSLDTMAGTAAPTIFDAPVVINQGPDDDVVTRGGSIDGNQEVIFFDTFVIHHGTGADTQNGVREFFPFMSLFQWII